MKKEICNIQLTDDELNILKESILSKIRIILRSKGIRVPNDDEKFILWMKKNVEK